MIRLTDSEFIYIVRYVKEQYGIDLEKKRILIECRLRKELERYGAGSFTQYFRLMEEDSSGKIEEEMMHRLTTHYTYFYRESRHFDFVRDTVLPEIEKTWRGAAYQIWCAGCSTGEEPYTLAMVFKNYEAQGGKLPPWLITATDISEEVLEHAREGIYSQKELEKLPVLWREKYCIPKAGKSFQMDKSLRSSIQFRRQNLMDPVSQMRQYDLILCRNVMIYFDVEVRKNLIRRLENSLKPGGYLLVGHSELLSREYTLLKSVGTAAYKKE